MPYSSSFSIKAPALTVIQTYMPYNLIFKPMLLYYTPYYIIFKSRLLYYMPLNMSFSGQKSCTTCTCHIKCHFQFKRPVLYSIKHFIFKSMLLYYLPYNMSFSSHYNMPYYNIFLKTRLLYNMPNNISFSGQGSCDTCIAGYYCEQGTVDPMNTPCPTGHYCPAGTQSALQYPCDSGTYNPNSTQTSASACVECDPGKYCGFQGQDADSGDCAPGYFCTGGSAEIMPYVEGNYHMLLYTVNSEIFARILFSQIGIKNIFLTMKYAARLGFTYISKRQSDFSNS